MATAVAPALQQRQPLAPSRRSDRNRSSSRRSGTGRQVSEHRGLCEGAPSRDRPPVRTDAPRPPTGVRPTRLTGVPRRSTSRPASEIDLRRSVPNVGVGPPEAAVCALTPDSAEIVIDVDGNMDREATYEDGDEDASITVFNLCACDFVSNLLEDCFEDFSDEAIFSVRNEADADDEADDEVVSVGEPPVGDSTTTPTSPVARSSSTSLAFLSAPFLPSSAIALTSEERLAGAEHGRVENLMDILPDLRDLIEASEDDVEFDEEVEETSQEEVVDVSSVPPLASSRNTCVLDYVTDLLEGALSGCADGMGPSDYEIVVKRSADCTADASWRVLPPSVASLAPCIPRKGAFTRMLRPLEPTPGDEPFPMDCLPSQPVSTDAPTITTTRSFALRMRRSAKREQMTSKAMGAFQVLYSSALTEASKHLQRCWRKHQVAKQLSTTMKTPSLPSTSVGPKTMPTPVMPQAPSTRRPARASKRVAPPPLNAVDLDSPATAAVKDMGEPPLALHMATATKLTLSAFEALPDPMLAVQKLMLSVNLPPSTQPETVATPRSGTPRHTSRRVLDCAPAPSSSRPSPRGSVSGVAPPRPQSRPTKNARPAKAAAFRMDVMDSPKENSKPARDSSLGPSYAALGAIQFHKMDADSEDESSYQTSSYSKTSSAVGSVDSRSMPASAMALDLGIEAPTLSSCAQSGATGFQIQRDRNKSVVTKAADRLPSLLPSITAAPGNAESIAWTMGVSTGLSPRRGHSRSIF